MKKLGFIILSVVFLTITLTGHTQTYEEYKKKEKEKSKAFSEKRMRELEQIREKRQQEIKQLKEEYKAYVERHDKAFADYLEKEWEAYQLFKGEKRKTEPKPEKIPQYKPPGLEPEKPGKEPEKKPEEKPEEEQPQLTPPDKEKPQEERQADIPFRRLKPFETEPLVESKATPQDIRPVIQKSIPIDFDFDVIDIDFYGKDLAFKVDPAVKDFSLDGIDQENISKAWTELAEMQSSKLVRQAYDYKQNLNLNDWAVFVLFRKLSGALSSDEPSQRALTWFFMNRAGYNAHIAFSNNDLTVLMPSRTEIYEKRFLTIDGQKFYLMDEIGGNQLYTYTSDYALAHKSMNLRIHKPLLLGDKVVTKEVRFEHGDKSYEFDFTYNANHIAFFEDYPLTDVGVYLNAPVSESLKNSLNEQLQDEMKPLGKEAAVNFLLAFSQKGFEYKKDPEQFGREKFFFPEEVFHYPYSDCEDRSAIFAYLVRELTAMDVVGLDYPGHLATAVNMGDDVTGSHVMVDNHRYVVADPTYVNAPYGMVMPQFSESPVKVVRVQPGELMRASRFWQLAQQDNAFRGSDMKDYAFDGSGNCYLTGYYTGNIQLGSVGLSGNQKKQAFVAKYSPDGKVLWAETLKNGNEESYSIGHAVTLLNDDTPVIAGIFSGNISNGRYQVSAEEVPSYYVCKFDRSYRPEWIKKSEVKEHFRDRRFLTAYSLNGQVTASKYYPGEDVIDTREGLFAADGQIYLTGTMASVPVAMNKSYASGASLDYAEQIKTVHDQLIKENVASSIAGLFAVTELVQNNGYVIPGSEAQKALDKYNPRFREKNPDLYENISSIKFLKNDEGIVTILSDTKKSVTFDKVKVRHNAKLKIESLPEGQQKIIALSGVSVGKYFVWYDLNSIKMFRESGDLLFDYDDDHTHKMVNMEDDILN